MGRLSVQSTQHGRSDTQGGLGSLFHAEPELSALKMHAITTSFSLLLYGHLASLSFSKAFRSLLHYTSDSFLFQLLLISMVSFSHIHGFHLHTIHKCMSNQSSLRPTRSLRTRYNAKEARARCGKSYIYIDTLLIVHVLDSEIVALSSDSPFTPTH